MGFADGFTIDEEGMLWVAHYGGSRVRRWNPETATVLAEVELPTASITACAFGGPGLDQLYITSASFRMSDAEKAEQPHAGGFFVADVGVRGLHQTSSGAEGRTGELQSGCIGNKLAEHFVPLSRLIATC